MPNQLLLLIQYKSFPLQQKELSCALLDQEFITGTCAAFLAQRSLSRYYQTLCVLLPSWSSCGTLRISSFLPFSFKQLYKICFKMFKCRPGSSGVGMGRMQCVCVGGGNTFKYVLRFSCLKLHFFSYTSIYILSFQAVSPLSSLYLIGQVYDGKAF